MTTHPQHLHATAAAWSLTTARTRLARHVTAEHRTRTDSLLDAAPGLTGWRPCTGHQAGGHADPIAGAALAALAGADVDDPATRLATSTTGTLRWLATRLHVDAGDNPLPVLRAAIPGLAPATAGNLAQWLDDLDERIRTALRMPDDRMPLPGACPGCGVRMLRARTAAPDSAAWVIVCGAGCLCAGPACECEMPVRPAGVAHAWAADSPLAVRVFDPATMQSGRAEGRQ